jgi:hypothetical protein
MAATFVLQYQAATGDQSFIQRVQMGMLQTCFNMKGEAPGAANHANRMALMKACANDPEAWAHRFSRLIASQGIDNSNTDAQIQAAISSGWDAMAGQV